VDEWDARFGDDAARAARLKGEWKQARLQVARLEEDIREVGQTEAKWARLSELQARERAAEAAAADVERTLRSSGRAEIETLRRMSDRGTAYPDDVREVLTRNLEQLRRPDEYDFAAAVSGKIDGRHTYLQQYRELDQTIMRATGPATHRVLQEMAAAGAKLGIKVRIPSRMSGTTRTVLRRLGYDAIRKADTYADALVVLNEKILQAPGRGLGPRARAQAVRAAEARMLAESTAGSVAQLRSRPRPAVRSTVTERPETTREFVGRVRERARETGRPERPLFAPSEEFGARRFADYTVGGTQLVSGPKRRKYALARKGTQRMTPEVVFEGIQRNIKQRHNAELIVKTFDRVAHPEARRLSALELKRFIEREGLNLSDVAIWFPGRFEEGLRRLGEAGEEMRAAGRRVKEGEGIDPAGDAGGALRPADNATLALVRDSAIVADTQSGLDAALAKFEGEGGTLIPRATYDEIFASTKGDTQAGRAMQRVTSLQSRAVLGTANVNWLLADTLANGAMSFLMEGITPVSYVRGRSFIRALPEELRREIDSVVDIGQFKSQTYIPHLGSTANSAFVNKWRALRSIPPGQDAHPLTRAAGLALRARPIQRGIDQFLKLERTVANIPPRRALFYKLLRDEAFRRMDAESGQMIRLTNRVIGHLSKRPEKMMVDLLEDKGMIEELGRRVDNALGDYQSFTAFERRFIGRFFFFYPYARFAVRALFYTLPVEHPIRTAVALRIGALTEEEQRELLGVGADEADELRSLMFGRAVFRDDEGNIREFNVRTVNPFGNPITESEGSESVLGVLPPVYQWALGQIEKRDIYRGTPWNIGGEFTRPTTSPKLGDNALENLWTRSRILARQMLELPVPTRELSKHFMPGPQSQESLPFDPIPLRHKSRERAFEDEQKAKRDAEEGLAEQLLRSQLRLFVSRPSEIEAQLGRRRKAVGLKTPAGKPDAETRKLLEVYGGAGSQPQMAPGEIERLLEVYGP
jgi:hypothetical protein